MANLPDTLIAQQRKPMKYKTTVIDPPWPGPGASPSFERGRAPILIPYSTMTGIQVASMRVPDLAHDQAQFFCWAISRSFGDAFLLMQLWGFQYRGLFVWLKPGLGLGRHIRHQCEFLLWGGRIGSPLVEPKQCPRQVQTWPNPPRHSEKPAEAYELIRSLSEEPRIDIFARLHRPGFDAWGNEVLETTS